METFQLYSIFNQASGICIDSRKIVPNSLFFALKGDNFDGNNFALKAIESGALYAIVDNKNFVNLNNPQLIIVDDVLNTLQELAAFHRHHIGLPVIALSGSNGKTTSKELLNAVLSKKYATISTVGNLNNHIGVPLTLLNIKEDTDIAIIEMGANHQKEIEKLCEIAQPDYGFITNFGKAHLEGFGGIDGVIKGKSELYDYLSTNNKTTFINFDDEIQLEKAQKINHYGYTFKEKVNADVKFTASYANPMATIELKNIEFISNLTGNYNITNIGFAITIGIYFNIPLKDIKEAIASYIPNNNRSQWITHNNKKVLLDAYNANPSSMKVAIENFKQVEVNSKTIILGDMFELGMYSDEEHSNIIKEVILSNINTFFIGESFWKNKIDHQNLSYFKTVDDFYSFMTNTPIISDVILIKGSRKLALENTLDFL